MTPVDTSREAVERAIHWWQQQDAGTEDDGAASALLGRICRAMLDERDTLSRELERLKAGISSALMEIEDAGPKALKYAGVELRAALAPPEPATGKAADDGE